MPSSMVPLGVLITLLLIAVHESRRKGRTLLVILGWILAGFALGAGIGFAAGSSGAAGGMGGIGILIMGIGASIKAISDNRKATKVPGKN